MGKFNWTINDLEYKLEVLEKKFENAKNNDERETILSDIDLIKKYIEEYYDNSKSSDTIKFLDKYKESKEKLQSINFIHEDFIDFYNYNNSFLSNFDELLTLKNNSLNRKDILTLTHDFYKQLNPLFYGNFMKVFYRRNDHTTFNPVHPDLVNGKSNGMSTTLLSTKESYIEIARNYTIDDVITTIHEYGHATSAMINPNHEFDSKYLYSEVDTLFLELAAIKYLNKVMHNKDAKTLKVMDFVERYNNSLDINDVLILINKEKKIKGGYSTNKILKETAFKTCNIYKDELDDILDYINYDSYIYLTGYIYALEFYNTYKEDKEKALNDLKKFIMLDASDEKTYYKRLKQFGIIPNLHLRNFQKEIQNDIYSLTRKK